MAVRETDSSSCERCGSAGRGTYYSRSKIGRECVRCGLRWVQFVSAASPRKDTD